ncbi:uncharacterized protein N7511_002780 [Penicillium nucicola]|uniref:uncharacterized protein n=1 Tax=Penicillium nucicola TaxID=1850975 RepID=UPI0025457BD0|nr:uncharacterized protein N7511_002780 [Penicillium nucicola]KAJ5770729.1 hypothetical protein N7511_002780 [Penicillium nucicola]
MAREAQAGLIPIGKPNAQQVQSDGTGPERMVKGVGPVSSARPAPARPKSSRHRRVLTQMKRRFFILDLVV